MARKLIISDKQLKTISDYIIENEVITEGFSDVTLGLLHLMGVELTGQNEMIGKEAVKNPDIINQVQAIMSDEERLTKFLDKVEDRIPNIRQIVNAKVGDIEQTVDGNNDND
jgi:hypothetical protein